MLLDGAIEHTPVGALFFGRLTGLSRPYHRDRDERDKLVKPVHHPAAKAHPQMRDEVPLKRLQPVTLPLSGKPEGLIPTTAPYPVAEAFQNDPDRRMMPGPVPERPHGVHRSAVRATPAAKFHRAVAYIVIPLHKPMAPNPGTSTAGAQTRPWPEKRILPPKPQNLLDTHHEKKRQ